jgi:hypothetical protein
MKFAYELVYVNILLTLVRIFFELFKNQFSEKKSDISLILYYFYFILDPIVNISYLVKFLPTITTPKIF